MISREDIEKRIFDQIKTVLEDRSVDVFKDMTLIGGDSLLDSMKLVELCVSLEDIASEIGFNFDWTSESAMSKSTSIFRTAGSLIDEFIRQKDSQK